MSTVGELLVKIGVNTAPLTAGIKQARAEMKALGAAGAESSGALGTAAKAAGVAGAAIAAGAAVIGVEAVKSAVKFNDSMTLIQTQAGATAAQVDAFKGQVLDLATVVPQGPDALAAGLYHVVSAGYSGAQAMDVLKLAAEGAAVGHADLESVTNALLASLKSGVGGIQNASQAMGTLNSIVGAGNMRMQDLTDAMGTGVLSTAKNYGVTIQDVGAALASMTSQGVPAIDAATRLNSAMRLMAAPTSAAQKALGAIGIDSQTLAADMRQPQGLLVALTDLQKHMSTGVPSAVQQMVASIEASSKKPAVAVKNITKELTGLGFTGAQVQDALKGHFDKLNLSAIQQAALIAHAFGGKQSGAILTLMGNLGLLKDKEDLVAKGAGGFGAAFAASQEDTAVQAAQLKATFDSLMVSIGEGLIPAVNSIVQAVAPVLKGMADFARQNPQLAGTILIVVGALGALAAAVALLGPVFAAIGTAIGAIGAVIASPVLLPILAVVAAIVLLVTHFNDVVNGLRVIAGVAMDVFNAIVGFIANVAQTLSADFAAGVAAVQSALGSLVTTVGQVFANIAAAIQQAIAFIGSVIGSAIDAWVTLYIRIPVRIASFVAGVIAHFLDLARRGLAIVVGFVGDVVRFVLSIPGKVIDLVARFLSIVHDIEANTVAAFLSLVSQVVGFLLGIPGKVIGGLTSGFANLARAAINAFMNIFGGIVSKVKSVIGSIPGIGAVIGAAGNVGSAIAGLVPHLQTGALSVPHDMLAFLHAGEMVVPAGPAESMRRGGPTERRTSSAGQPMIGNVNIYNPAPEPASTSFRREVDKMQRLTAFGY